MPTAGGFHAFAIENGLLFEEAAVRLHGLRAGELELPGGATHFGMVAGGAVDLELGDSERFSLRDGTFFVAPERARLASRGGASALVITLAGYVGLRQLGGPVEPRGRLRYIDGCSDTLLVCPPRLGEPCLNHLHIPAGTHQSAHTHDSDRLGLVLRGRGLCRTEAGDTALGPGLAWRIAAGCRHSFLTDTEPLDVLAWHPDSDFGPTDDDHPMINRTLLRR